MPQPLRATKFPPRVVGIPTATPACQCTYHRVARGEILLDGTAPEGNPQHGRDCLRELTLDSAKATACQDWQRAIGVAQRLVLVSTLLCIEAATHLLMVS